MQFTMFRTAWNTEERLALVEPSANAAPSVDISLDSTVRFQTIRGFGGAFTEAGGWVLSQIPQDKREEIIRGYFDPVNGLGYSLCRAHINSCDFSLGSYSCCDTDSDMDLLAFNLDRDEMWLLPFIRHALSEARGELELMVTPWSPPAWMKTNKAMNGGGKLRPDCWDAWARFLTRFVQAYRQRGVPVGMISVQNEPEAVQQWESCIWTAEEEGRFVAEHLGPALEKAGLGAVDILIWDHNRDAMVRRASGAMGYGDASRYIHGTAYHWYNGEDFQNVAKVHELFPDKHLYFTEGCLERPPGRADGAVSGEHYAHHIINDMNNWCEGWIDWNMVLSAEGGPNHAGNYCDAPVVVEVPEGRVTCQGSFWSLGHFSRFVRPGFSRIACDVCGNIDDGNGIEAAAFSRTARDAVAVILNRTGAARNARIHAFGGTTEVDLAPHSIQTLCMEAGA